MILTNVTYIGYWVYNGVVYQRNHEAIVDEETFWYVFNRLSSFTIDGKENVERMTKVRFRREDSREVPALLKECIESTDPKLPVYVQFKNANVAYYFIQADTRPVESDFRSIQVAILDTLYSEKLLAHLRDSQEYEHYQTFLQRRTNERTQKQKRLQEQRTQLMDECKGLRASLRKPTLTDTVREALETDLAVLLDDLTTIEAALSELTKGENFVSLDEYHMLLTKLAPQWEKLRLEKRKMLVQATTKRVIFEPLTPHFVRVTFEWENPTWGTDSAIIWRKRGGTPEYTDKEDHIVRTHYPKADRKELLSLLPNRSWNAIIHRGVELRVKRQRRSEPSGMPDFLSLHDYEFALEAGLEPQSLQMETQVIWSSPKCCLQRQR